MIAPSRCWKRPKTAEISFSPPAASPACAPRRKTWPRSWTRRGSSTESIIPKAARNFETPDSPCIIIGASNVVMTAERIKEQLETYRDATWKVNHRPAMECCDLDDWLALGLSLLDAIRTIDLQYQDRVRLGRNPFKKETIEAIRALYEIWAA